MDHWSAFTIEVGPAERVIAESRMPLALEPWRIDFPEGWPVWSGEPCAALRFASAEQAVLQLDLAFGPVGQAREQRLKDVDVLRQAACREAIWQGQRVVIGKETIARLDSAIATVALLDPPSREWALRPHVYRTCSLADLKSLRVAINAWIEAAFVRAAELTTAILSADEVDQVTAIDVAGGWPE